uniref:B30.2/SPRY domain-containing protein n=2 Tax=Sparus aurata TaxID=8175 RepID=A0A671WAV6_SPAAU
MGEPPHNLALRNLSDALRQERSQRAESKEICSLHREEFKLFCQDDQELICVICRDSQKHKTHNFIPVNEAAEAQRNQLKVPLMTLKIKLGKFNKQKLNCDKMESHIKLQAQQTEKTIKEEFQKLYQFLRAEDAARTDVVRIEATLNTLTTKLMITYLTVGIFLLTHLIETIEKEMRAEDISFMLNVKSTMERSQCNLPEPETPSGALIDEAKHLGNLLFTVWIKMKNIIQYSPVTLDPNTGGSLLTISENMTRSKSDKDQPHPYNTERLSTSTVLGSHGFSSGKHYWDVEVKCYYGVGVAAKDLMNNKIWSIYTCGSAADMHERTPEGDVLIKTAILLNKIRVQLDYDKGILSFYDLRDSTLIHTIKHTFTETVFPFFSENAKILPAELSVVIKKPR